MMQNEIDKNLDKLFAERRIAKNKRELKQCQTLFNRAYKQFEFESIPYSEMD